MNLQVCVPYEKCPFNCPMCIASKSPLFHNLYKENRDDYLELLDYNIENLQIDDVVITGATEPTLNRHWLNDILPLLHDAVNGQIELQTKNYNLEGYDLDYVNTLAYSITKYSEYLKSWRFRKLENSNNRLTILLTKDFEGLSAENFEPMGYNQITFKVLQYTGDEKTDAWIKANTLQDLTSIYDIVNKYNGTDISVRIDTSCQDSVNRYYVFREDGKVYTGWDDKEPIE